MWFFPRKERSGSPGRRSIFSRKKGHALPETASEPAASKPTAPPASSNLGREEHAGDDVINARVTLQSPPPAKVEVSATAQTLWDRAYDALREENRELVDKYEKLLSKELLATKPYPGLALRTETTLDDDENVLAQTNRQARQEQLDTITKHGLERIKENTIEYHIFGRAFVLKDQISQAVGVVRWAQDWIAEAVKVSPEASIAWAGVCLVLPLLTNAHDADEANRDGFARITNRMRYYTALEPLLLELIRGSSSTTINDKLRVECEAHIVDLYQKVLDFQFRSVLRFYRNWFGNFGQDLIQTEDWKQLQLKVKELEDIVYKDFEQINGLLSTQQLDSLNEKTTKTLQNLSQILSTAEKQLRVAEEIRGLALERNKLALTLAEEQKQKQEELEKQKCHRVFRITKGEKDDSYEWYKNRVEHRVKGTCKWFLTHPNFLSWLKQDAGPLLVSADPGCGKSVLARYLIDDELPRTAATATICYFFFKDQDQNTLQQALCALLHQLFSQNPDLIRHAVPEYKTNGSKIVTLTATLWKILKDATQDPAARPTIFVLDALDECAETDFQELIELVRAFFLQEPTKFGSVKFLLTSRPYDSVVSEFRGLVGAFPYIRIPGEEESDAIGEEVNRVIKHRVQKLQFSTDIKQHLEQRLTEIPHRTYLWVYLVFDYLEKSVFKKTPKHVESIVATLPQSVNQAYEKILERHENSEIVRKALSIILAASRPLTLTEMNIAINTNISSRSFEDLDLEKDDDFQDTLRSWCGLFISIYHGQVYFLHQTAREFLLVNLASPVSVLPASEWHQSIQIHQAHRVLAEVCVVYLNFFNSRSYSKRGGNADLHHNNHDFLDYSAKNWGSHFRLANISNNEHIVPLAAGICNMKSISYSTWLNVFWQGKPPGNFSDLIVASYFGHEAVAKLLLEHGAEVESKDNEYGQTPLSWAAEKGHEAVAKLLLEHGAEVESKDKNDGQTPLSWAARYGHEAVAKLLLEHGAEVESKDKEYGQTPLSWAAQNGHEAVAKLLLEHSAEVESKDKNDGQTPLSWAARYGHEAVAKLLLEHGAEVESKDNEYGQTPLSWAARNGHEAVAKLLLEHGAEVESKDKEYGRTPLSWAAEKGHEAVAKLLLEHGAEVESKDNKYGQTPLSWAAENGHEAVAKLLLEHGAEVESKDKNDGQTPLSWAARNGHEAVAKLLLEHGAEVESKDKEYGQTPLSWAAQNGHEAVAKLLLEHGAEVESKDKNDGQTPLSWAAQNGHEAVAKLLLEHGAEVESKDNKYGRTPLSWAARYGHEAVAKLLLEHGAKDVRDS